MKEKVVPVSQISTLLFVTNLKGQMKVNTSIITIKPKKKIQITLMVIMNE